MILLAGVDPVWPLLAVAAGLAAVVALEERHHRKAEDPSLLLD